MRVKATNGDTPIDIYVSLATKAHPTHLSNDGCILSLRGLVSVHLSRDQLGRLLDGLREIYNTDPMD